jgi:DNA-binding transcriptional regulator GbsR (MarR family)
MLENRDLNDIVEEGFLSEISYFETFFHRMGFKRTDGAVFGLLALAKRSVSSEEIEAILKLSQSATSQSLKILTLYGCIETNVQTEKRIKYHSAKNDGLEIVASIFKKREQEYVLEFKNMAKTILEKTKATGESEDSPRVQRFKSIVATCEVAESVINLVLRVSQHKMSKEYKILIQRLPKAIDLIGNNSLAVMDFTSQLKTNLTSKFKDKLEKFAGE